MHLRIQGNLNENSKLYIQELTIPKRAELTRSGLIRNNSADNDQSGVLKTLLPPDHQRQ